MRRAGDCGPDTHFCPACSELSRHIVSLSTYYVNRFIDFFATAVLSTHTMFRNFTCKDLSDQIEPIAAHWKSEGVAFDAIYGYSFPLSAITGSTIITVSSPRKFLNSSFIWSTCSAVPRYPVAMRIAADYTAHTIEVTLQNPDKPWYGVDFEATIPELLAMK